jgi:F-box/WD-40 domain protein MET30
MWKNIYTETHAIERNWKKGSFTTREFKGYTSSIWSLQMNEKLKRLVTGSHDKTIRVWDIDSRECIKVLEGHTNSVRCLQFDDSKIISGSWDRTVKIWDFKTFECIKTLQSDMGFVLSVHFLDNILAAGCDYGIKIWNLDDYSSFELRGHTDWVSCVQVVSSNLLLSSSGDSTVKLWNLNTRTVIQSIDVGSEVYNFKLLLSPIQSNANEWTALPPGKLLLACFDGDIKIYDTESGDLLKTLKGHSSVVRCVDADDSRIISVANDCSLIMYLVNILIE